MTLIGGRRRQKKLYCCKTLNANFQSGLRRLRCAIFCPLAALPTSRGPVRAGAARLQQTRRLTAQTTGPEEPFGTDRGASAVAWKFSGPAATKNIRGRECAAYRQREPSGMGSHGPYKRHRSGPATSHPLPSHRSASNLSAVVCARSSAWRSARQTPQAESPGRSVFR